MSLINTSEYIYIREHESYSKYKTVKLGKTNNLRERDSTYRTGEIKSGYFIEVYEILNNNNSDIEKILQEKFKQHHEYYNSGTEFYKISILNKIEIFLILYRIQYKKLSKDEIKNIAYNKYDNEGDEENEGNGIITIYDNDDDDIIYKPRDYQKDIIAKSMKYFKNNDKGILNLTCGLGKTLISLWIAKGLNCNKILIGVPGLILLEQWQEKVKIMFPYFNILSIQDDNYDFINYEKFILLVNYQSINKVIDMIDNKEFKFDLIINDECHHLTGLNNNDKYRKQYLDILKIKTKKQLSLTATIKIVENDSNKNNIVSNNNIEQFGEIIDSKSLLWGIENNIICDYEIQKLIYTNDDINNILNINNFLSQKVFNNNNFNYLNLFLAALSALQSIYNNDTKHILIYTNTTENAEIVIKFIHEILNSKIYNINDLSYNSYHSNLSNKQINILDTFKNSKYGIIACVYCLGEGYDLPLLDGVIFAENMESHIRIIQSALRPCRKNLNNPNKIAKIILPVIYTKSKSDIGISELKKIENIIIQIGNEDKNIIYKIKAYNFKFNNNISNIKNNNIKKVYNEFNGEETEYIKLSIFPRYQLTYKTAKNILKNYNIKNKEEYFNLCENNNILPKEPIIYFNKKFIGWINYLNIETNNYYTFNECQQIINSLYNSIYIYNIYDLILNLYKTNKKIIHPDFFCELYKINKHKDIIMKFTSNKIDYKL